MKSIIVILYCLLLSHPVFSQDKITEKVTVDWWVIPIFAVDSNGNSVLDLQKEDITLKMNNKEIDQFYLTKQQFIRTEQKISQRNPFERDKMIFLLFDLTLSTTQSIEHSKSIASQIVAGAEKNHRFIIMSIQPFTGLKFVAGPLQNKELIHQVISRKIKGRSDSRVASLDDFIASTSGDKQGKYSEENLRDVFRPGAERFTKHKSMTFFQSFELLYYALNSIKDNKFIYLFTEGISKTAQTSGKHMESAYHRYLNQMAGYLGKSGAVLFVINPSGTSDSATSGGSGEDSLRFLAKESGGRYFEGSNDNIKTEIENVHRAYYEIAFPDIKGIKGETRRITVYPKRKGVSIHTLRSLEKNKKYSDMNQLEREILVLNLLNRNSVFQIGMTVEDIRITETIREKEKTIYVIIVPERSDNMRFDLFQIWVDQESRNPLIESQTVRATANKVKVIMAEKKGKESYFVLINGTLNLALVRGLQKSEADAILEEVPEPPALPQTFPPPLLREKIVYDDYATAILNNVAGYCEKLQNSAFHFICKEKVVEIFEELVTNYRTAPERDYGDRYVAREGMDQQTRSKSRMVKQYLYDYQLIKQNGKITEQRLPLNRGKDSTAALEIESKMGTFFSKKIVLAPILLLSKEFQNQYQYEFKGREKIKGISMIVIEATPMNSIQNEFLFGTLWIDPRDFSIRKIKVNPRSIRGFAQLEAIARKLKAKLNLSAEIEFGNLKNGIRFPSEVTVVENYQGGPIISRLRGKKGWDRSKTVYSYKDYQFFNVQTEVTTE
jgi:hypothetical protein